MATPPALGTRINGKMYDFSSVQIVTDAVGVICNITDINYSHGLDPGVLRGTGANWRGRSRGTYDAQGSFTIYKEDYVNLIKILAGKGMGGYMTATFQIMVFYREAGLNIPAMDQLLGCRIKNDDDSHSSGNDVIVTKVDLSVFKIVRNGVQAVDTPSTIFDYVP